MLGFGIQTFLTLLVILDPIGLVPVFVSLAGSRPPEERRAIARRAVLVAGLILVAFGVGGAWLLQKLDISLGAFRVAGGLLLFKIAFDMIFAQHERETPEEAAEARSRQDLSVFPLAIPLIAGPGALASVMILTAEAPLKPYGLALVLGMTVFVLALCYVALRLSGLLARALGRTGVNVVTRVLGVLLAALAVQYVADGARSLLAGR